MEPCQSQSHGSDCPCRSSKFLANSWTAAHYGDAGRLAHLLHSHGKPPSVQDEYGATPLHYAAAGGHMDCVALLLSVGADVNAAGCGALPLHRAAYGGHGPVVTALLDGGSRVNDQDASTGDLRTPLAKAAGRGHGAVCLQLLAAGADATIGDGRSGLPPWQLVPLLHDDVERPGSGALAPNDDDVEAAFRALFQAPEAHTAGAARGARPSDAGSDDSAGGRRRQWSAAHLALAVTLARAGGVACAEDVVQHVRVIVGGVHAATAAASASTPASSSSAYERADPPVSAGTQPAALLGSLCEGCGAMVLVLRAIRGADARVCFRCAGCAHQG